MFGLFNKSRLLTVLTLLSLSTLNSSLTASDCCDPCDNHRVYIGAFGGGLYSNSTKVYQLGSIFFLEGDDGVLAVNARGHTKKTSTGFGGVQIGYEWLNCGCSGWSITPAVELEAYWFSHNKKGHLVNPSDRLDEHDFLDTFHLNTGVYLANAVFSLNSSCLCGFSPYIGGGVGAARISIKNAKSLQVSPLEEGINHFNGKNNDTSWAFAAQAKAGLRYTFCNFHIFGEYRYLFIDTSNYIFGSTAYPTHVPSSPWNVEVQNIQNNAFVFGIQYDL